jgi:hypothetical protein
VRDIAQLLLISPNTVLKTLRAEAAKVSEPKMPRRVRDLEMDEF